MKVTPTFLYGGAISLHLLATMKALDGKEVSSTIYFAAGVILWSLAMTLHLSQK